ALHVEQILHPERHATKGADGLAPGATRIDRGGANAGAICRHIRKGVERRIVGGDTRERSLGDGRSGDLAARHRARDPERRGLCVIKHAQARNTGAGSASSGRLNSAANAANLKITSRLARIVGCHVGSIDSLRALAEAEMKSSRAGADMEMSLRLGSEEREGKF